MYSCSPELPSQGGRVPHSRCCLTQHPHPSQRLHSPGMVLRYWRGVSSDKKAMYVFGELPASPCRRDTEIPACPLAVPRQRRAGEGRRRGQPPAIDNPRAQPRRRSRREPTASQECPRAPASTPQRAVSAPGTERRTAGALGGNTAQVGHCGALGDRSAQSRVRPPNGRLWLL